MVRTTLATALAAISLGGCNGSCSCNSNAAAGSAPSATSLGPVVPASATATVTDPNGPIDALPIPQSAVAAVVNPAKAEKYSGPWATLHGTIRVEGDAPPATTFSFPQNCGEAAATYGRLFRVGQDKALADALVAVTFEQAYVPETQEVQTVTIHGCALNTRTIAVTFGQRIDVANREETTTSYLPYLKGSKQSAVMVAVPQGSPVKLYPTEPKAHYLLADEMGHPYLTADVFVLAYPTHAVTGLDGKYTIKNIPAKHVRVSAVSPAIGKVVEKQIDLKEGDNALDLTITFDKSKEGADASPHASTTPSASAPPKK